MKQRSGVIGHKESGVGIVEVMVAAAILSTAVGGASLLPVHHSSALPLMSLRCEQVLQ